MATLIVTGNIRGSASTLCHFELSVNNGPFTSPDHVVFDKSFFTIPDTPVPIAIRASAVDAAKYGTLEGQFQLDAAGTLQPIAAPAEFTPAQPLGFPPLRSILLSVHFTPLMDVTGRARDALRFSGPDFPGPPPNGDMSFRQSGFVTPTPPASLQPRELSDLTFIDSPSISGSALRVTTRTSHPQGSITIFEWRGATAPKLYAVFWPTAVARGPGAPPTPFLLYYHPTAGQNAPEFYTDARDRHDPTTRSTYPWGFDYQFFGFWRYLNYEGDSLKKDPFCKGLPHQIEASGKNVVLVLPLNRVAANPCDETIMLRDASFVQELLEELQAYVMRRAGLYQPPGIGHFAMASFSSGHFLLSCFLQNAANHTHPLYLQQLREIYLFDPHADRADITLLPVIDMARWAGQGASETKVARLYTQNNVTQLAPVFAQLGVPAGSVPFDATSPFNPRHSVACLPLNAWNALATSVGSTFAYINTQASHQAISALMLTDALRRSDF